MNQGTSPLMVLPTDCNRVIEQISKLLSSSGFTVVESFDLQVARANHRHCTCPHHGTDQCPCQLAVLLVYGTEGNPVVLTIHGNGEKTELFIAETAEHKVDPAMKKEIVGALESKHFILTDSESMAGVP